MQSQAYLEPCQTSMEDFFCEIIFAEKLHHIYLTGFLRILWQCGTSTSNIAECCNWCFHKETDFKDFACVITHKLIKSFHTRSLSNRSNCLKVFCTKSVLKNFAKFTGKQSCKDLFFNKVAGLPATLLKRDSCTGVFLKTLRNFSKHLFIQNTSGGCFCSNPKETCFQWVQKETIEKQPAEVFHKKGVLKNLTKFTRKHLRQNLFLLKTYNFI